MSRSIGFSGHPSSRKQLSVFIEKPKLRRGVLFHPPRNEDDDDVIVLTGGEPFFVSRLVFETLTPLLTGENSLAQLAAALKGVLSAAQIVVAVQLMAKRGAVFDLASAHDHDEATVVAAQGTVFIHHIGRVQSQALPGLLAEAGLAVSATAEAAQFTLAITDHYLRNELSSLNRTQTGPWLLVRPVAQEMWLGPLIVPGETACWECLAHRLRFNSRIEQFVAAETGEFPFVDTAVLNQPPSARNVVFALAAQFARDWINGIRRAPLNTLVAIDPTSMSMTHHHIVRRPQCPACGTEAVVSPGAINLETRPRPQVDVLVRDNHARETLARFSHHISPVTGLLPMLTNTSRAAGIYVYGGGAYASHQPRSHGALMSMLRYRAAGKGLTEAAAKASALAETLEWYTLGAQPHGSLEIDSYDCLSRRARAIAPPALTHFSATQFTDRKSINRANREAKYHVPEPFDPSRDIGWLKVWSLTNREWAFVPGAACAPSYSCPFVKGNSNGNAAGATLEQAVLHGALEAVERDAVALWWYNFAPRPAAVPDGVDPELLAAMEAHYRSVGRRFWLLDITTEFGVSVMAAISIAEGQTTGRPVMGFGAHRDPVLAAQRALTELNQLLPDLTVVSPRDGRDEADSGGAMTLPAHIFPNEALPPRRLAAPSPPIGDAAGEVVRIIDALAARGLEMLVADLTLPDVGMPVVKVLIPGLRHAYPELGPGRLHDVPLTLGWIDQPVPEARMRDLRSPL